MYIIRETFIAKPGHAGELVQLMKEEMKSMKDFKGHILLDLVTDYNKIVIEFELESLAEWEKMVGDMNKQKEETKAKGEIKPPKYTELYQTGKREIFRVVL